MACTKCWKHFIERSVSTVSGEQEKNRTDGDLVYKKEDQYRGEECLNARCEKELNESSVRA